MPATPSDLARLDRDHHLHPFTDPKVLLDDAPIVMAGGRDSTLWDEDGKLYLDALAGLWCVNVGYGRKELAEVAAEQMARLAYYNTFFKTTTAPTAALAARLAALMPEGLDHVVFANSGSEALDTIVRFCRLFWELKGQPDKKTMIGREEGYHGSTLATISLGGTLAMQAQGSLPLAGFEHVNTAYKFRHGEPGERDDAFAERAAGWIEAKIVELGADKVAGVVVEPVQGAGGVIIPPPDYLARVQEICRRHDVLFALDEVVSAFGRLGAWSAAEKFGLAPDFMALAKGLSSGYQPISAVMVGRRVAETLIEKSGGLAHGFTYAGHPVAAAVALANLEIIEREGLVDRVRDDLGDYFAAALARLGDHPMVGEVRSLGLIGAVELVQQRDPKILYDPEGLVGAVVRDQMQNRGVIVRAVRDALVIAPPLVITHREIDRIADTLRLVLDDILEQIGVVGDDRALAEITAGGGALKGLTCLVTGASRGIGAAVAERYAAEGARVVLAARSQTELEAVAARIRKAGGQVATLVLDLSDPAATQGLGKRIGEKLGRLDVVVANHGVLGEIAPLAEVSDATFDQAIAVNLTATFRLLHELDPLLRAAPSGRVLLVTSGAAQGAMPDWGAYAASKAGLEALARAYAAETRSGRVRVNLVDPGEVRTGMRAAAFPEEDPNRLPTPQEITGVFVRLASPACTFSGARVPASVEV